MSSSTVISIEQQEDANYQKLVEQHSIDTKRRELRRAQTIEKKGVRQYHIDLYTVNEQRNEDTERYLFSTALEDARAGKSFQMVVFDASSGEKSKSVLVGAPSLPRPGEKVLFNGSEVPVIAARLMLQIDDSSHSKVFVDVLVDAPNAS